MEQSELTELRNKLIELRNECLIENPIPDFDGAVMLSHLIRWFSFKIEGKPYKPPTD